MVHMICNVSSLGSRVPCALLLSRMAPKISKICPLDLQDLPEIGSSDDEPPAKRNRQPASQTHCEWLEAPSVTVPKDEDRPPLTIPTREPLGGWVGGWVGRRYIYIYIYIETTCPYIDHRTIYIHIYTDISRYIEIYRPGSVGHLSDTVRAPCQYIKFIVKYIQYATVPSKRPVKVTFLMKKLVFSCVLQRF